LFDLDESVSTHISSLPSFPPIAIVCKSGISNFDLMYPSPSLLPLLQLPHLRWLCTVDNPASLSPLHIKSLIDCGSHIVLIHPNLVDHLGLHCHLLKKPLEVSLAMSHDEGEGFEKSCNLLSLKEWVKLKFLIKNAFGSQRAFAP